MPLTTILLDLDDTLLTIDMECFVHAYVKGLTLALSDFADAEQISAALLEATHAILPNEDPALTNEQVFFESFLPHLHGPFEQIEAAVATYFSRDYPTLKRFTQPRPAAPLLVQALFCRNYKVVIATNPLYPKPAIEQRLAWTDALDFPYQLVTAMENMHACKPSPAYYQEILQTIDSQPAETLMVGDDPKNDIAPAGGLGCQTWWIPGNEGVTEGVQADYQGSLDDLLTWVEEGRLATS